MPVFGIVNGNRGSPQNRHIMLIKPHGKVIGYLTTHGKYNTHGFFKFNDIHYPFKGEFIEIQPVAGIIIRTDGFRVIIDHNER
jgi:hypothetical protein